MPVRMSMKNDDENSLKRGFSMSLWAVSLIYSLLIAYLQFYSIFLLCNNGGIGGGKVIELVEL